MRHNKVVRKYYVLMKLDNISELPSHLQPRRIKTMQAVDAPMERSCYINSPEYWGQAKRDGSRLIVIATPDTVYYQSRSRKMKRQPSEEINQALYEAASKLGTFILDGELYYRSVTGSEHRTLAQAATINATKNVKVSPTPIYAIFKALWFDGKDLTIAAETERIAAGEKIGEYLRKDFFEVLPTAKSLEEKTQLALKQESEGREGEIWVLKDCVYQGGKDKHSQAMLRTKYCLELDLVVTDLTSVKDVGRPFSAAIVAQEVEDKLVPRGSLVIGFSLKDMKEIVRRHTAEPGSVKVTVRCLGLTENGKLWHGRFVGLCE
ncbi:MAG: ATP-dependent DNA ligase [Cyanobacteriota bacterium]|nr:ATP-dependent DNA ligase [Cyanobacteriota bacterium]